MVSIFVIVMLFKKDHDEKKDAKGAKNIWDMKDIKQAIEEPPAHEEMPFPSMPPALPATAFPSHAYSPHGREQSAPLFVKVEKYREVISSIQEMKLFIAGVKDTFAILQELEHVRSDAINIMKVTVQRLEKATMELDSELLRPRGVNISPFEQGETEAKHIESSLTELQKQLLELKQDLQGMR